MPKKSKVPAKKEVGLKKEISAGASSQQRIAYLAEEKFEKEKRMITYTGVSFFMILILVFWVINFKRNFQDIAVDQNSSLPEWGQLTEKVKDTIEGAKNNIVEVKNEIQGVGTIAVDAATSSASAVGNLSVATTTRNSFLPALKTKLEDSKEIKK